MPRPWGIAALATFGVIVRPWNLPEFIWAAAGAALLAEVARQEGLFDWLAAQAVRHSDRSAKRLFLIVYVVGTLVAVLPISDPANLVVFGKQMPPLSEWLRAFALPSVVAIVVTYVVLPAQPWDRAELEKMTRP
jgi:arsenical pump membrane protein